MPLSMISAALVAALVGYGASVAILVAAAEALGAGPAELNSWLLAICLAKAVGSAGLSLWHRMPLVLAWSTPGAALVAATTGMTMPQAVGAFLVAGLMIAATAAIAPVGKLVARIPDGIAAAMLAGVLLPFCLKGVVVAPLAPALVLPMVAVFLIVRLWNPAFAVLAALALGLILAFAGGLPDLALFAPALVLIPPEVTPGLILGLALPLYLVTMASQNLPGFATLRAAGYEPPVTSALAVTGGLSAVTAPLGAHPVSMAAITAAICLGPDVHPDPAQRWRVGLAYAAVWVCLGLLSPTILQLLAALPDAVLAAVVALALLSPLTGALTTGFAVAETRVAAAVTLGVTASGVTALGIGAAFWGLVAGLSVWSLDRAAARLRG
jgi:benzoate membrane transport protein